MFLATTAVMVDEFSKLSLRFFMVWLHWYRSREDKKQGIDDFVRHLRRQFDVRSSLLMAVPALLYTVQKNLLYVALSNLDACVYQAAYTGKHITTALFSYLILGKQLNHWQKGSLLVLMFGVALVQISQLTESRKQTGDHPVLGFVAVALACCTSGFSSAYLEYFIKKADYWGKQVQLAVPALLFAFAGVARGREQRLLPGLRRIRGAHDFLRSRRRAPRGVCHKVCRQHRQKLRHCAVAHCGDCSICINLGLPAEFHVCLGHGHHSWRSLHEQLYTSC